MVKSKLILLHIAKKGKQKCCCCKAVVDKSDLELWTCPEYTANPGGKGTTHMKRTGNNELHALCGDCVHRIDGKICKPVNRILVVDDDKDPPVVSANQVF